MVGLENAAFIANKIVDKKLSVRQSEKFVQLFKKGKSSLKKKDLNISDLEISISSKIGLRVEIQNKKIIKVKFLLNIQI